MVRVEELKTRGLGTSLGKYVLRFRPLGYSCLITVKVLGFDKEHSDHPREYH